ncbi:hypothetical protein JRC04_05130 [Mycolicibacterium sp. S2-37]|uniref:hypothetical protein n=1 Tax=Mycolicibacterium sp. S2-37 TaxID=2810297 RepID=UPI001A949728|nr:hypothetical protein [Mycolicibacterium sp. S2-37]MBO0676840.1 hypothetical protein [Mycolicibacterium sp. S2-37]
MNEDAYTLMDDEAASQGEVVWCFTTDAMEGAPPLAVMISPERYNELLEIEWMYQDLSD